MTTQPSSVLPSQSIERLPRWNITMADFGIFVAMLLSSIVIGSALFDRIARAFVNADATETPLIVLLAQNFGMQVGMLAAYWGILAITGRNLLFPDLSGNADPQSERNGETRTTLPLGKSVLIGLKWLLYSYPILLGISFLWTEALTRLGFEKITQEPVQLVQNGGSPFEQAFIYVMIVALAPICEELVFRAGIFRYLHHRLPLAAAAFLSAAIFAGIHFNLYSFAPLLVIGVTLALSYRESGNIASAITLHAAFNSLSLLAILFVEQGNAPV